MGAWTSFKTKTSTAPALATANMELEYPSTATSGHFLLSSNLMNKALWAFGNADLGKAAHGVIEVSQATLDQAGFDMVRLYTDDINIVLSHILDKYEPKKGLYVAVQNMPPTNPDTNRIQIRNGKLQMLLTMLTRWFVDTDSSLYPQAAMSDCKTCTQVGMIMLRVYVDVGATFTTDNFLETTHPTVEILDAKGNMEFTFDENLFKRQ